MSEDDRLNITTIYFKLITLETDISNREFLRGLHGVFTIKSSYEQSVFSLEKYLTNRRPPEANISVESPYLGISMLGLT